MVFAGGTLLIGCGALDREMLALIEAQGWRDMAVTCLPACVPSMLRLLTSPGMR